MTTAVAMSGAQFHALPCEECRRWELLDGELIGASSKTLLHQLIVCQIFDTLSANFRRIRV
jgi:hypothetical protein